MKHSQDKPSPHYGLALFKLDFPAVQTGTRCNEYTSPAERESNICVGIYLFEEFWS